MRVIINIGVGYNDNGNEVLHDRCLFYTDMVEELLEDLRGYQIEIDAKDQEVTKLIGNVALETMTALASFEV